MIMIAQIVFGALQASAFVIVMAWAYCGVSLIFTPRVAGRTYTAFHELRPLFLPSVLLFYLSSVDLSSWLWMVGFASGLASWPTFRRAGGDDDRWKRRRQAVVPESTGGQS